MTIKGDLKCPHCGERVFLHFRDKRQGPSPLFPRVDVQWLQWWDPGGSSSLEAFICKGCGFTEWYARDLDGIRADPERGIDIVDARAPASDVPFR